MQRKGLDQAVGLENFDLVIAGLIDAMDHRPQAAERSAVKAGLGQRLKIR